MQRRPSNTSTLRSENGYFTYIITARRIISSELLKALGQRRARKGFKDRFVVSAWFGGVCRLPHEAYVKMRGLPVPHSCAIDRDDHRNLQWERAAHE
jgi:hypothetical protein